MACSIVNLKSNVDKTPPCFRPNRMANVPDKFYLATYQPFLHVKTELDLVGKWKGKYTSTDS
jgi:hypothetical protein